MISEASEPWLFRVASRPEVGAGHVSRCRVLAHALGEDRVVFVLDREGRHWEGRLNAQGIAVAYEGRTASRRWAGSVLDSYSGEESQEMELEVLPSPLVVLADHVAPPRGTSLFVNASPHLNGVSVGNVPALLGPRYALVDPRFANTSLGTPEHVRHILVSFGARDAGNATGAVLRALELVSWGADPPRCTVAIGATAVHLTAIREQVATAHLDTTLLVDAPDMAALLKTVGLAVGAAGVSLLERMAAGVPSLTINTAASQSLFAAGAGTLGGTRFIGERDNLTPADIADAIALLVRDGLAREAMAARSRSIIDGRGAERVAAAVRGLLPTAASADRRTTS